MTKIVFKRLIISNEKGLTLIELLAVVVILGIISSVGIVSITGVISVAKDQAFVANAITLKDAAHLYLKDEEIQGNPQAIITYKKLHELNYLEEFRDPYTGEKLEPSNNDSYVIVTGRQISDVCFYGKNRNLCSKSGPDTPIPIDDLSRDLIQSN